MKNLGRHLVTVSRLLLGLTFFVEGLDGFFHVLPRPAMPAPAAAFVGALAASGYLFPLLKATELVAGALLLSGRLVPFAALLLAPVLVNIAAFHAFLAPEGLGFAAILVALELHVAWSHRGSYAPLFARGARAGSGGAAALAAADAWPSRAPTTRRSSSAA